VPMVLVASLYELSRPSSPSGLLHGSDQSELLCYHGTPRVLFSSRNEIDTAYIEAVVNYVVYYSSVVTQTTIGLVANHYATKQNALASHKISNSSLKSQPSANSYFASWLVQFRVGLGSGLVLDIKISFS